MKKLAVLTAATALSLAVLTGCGTPDVETIVDGMYDTTFESAKMEVAFDVDVAAEVEDEEYAVKASGEFTIDAVNVNSVDELSMAITGSVEYDVMDGMYEDDMDIEAYYITEDDEQTIYYKNPEDGEYYYQTNPIEESGVEISEKDMKKIQDAAKELWYTAEVSKKTEEINGEKCYVLTMTPSGEDYVKLMDSVVKVMDMKSDWEDFNELVEDELDSSVEEILDNCNIEFTAYVSAKNKYIMGCKVDMSNIDVESMIELVEDELDDLGVEIGDITIDACSFSVMYSDIDAVEVEVPKKVKKGATEVSSYYGASYDSYEDDFDYDLDDIEDEDEDDDDTGVTEVATADSSIYDEKTGKFTVYDYSDNALFEFTMPEGWDMSYYSDEGHYFTLYEKSSYNYIDINIWSSPATDYLIDNVQPDEEYYKNFDIEYEETTLGGVDVYVVLYSYDYDEDYTVTSYDILVPYTNHYGEDDAITISIDEDIANDWNDGGSDLIAEILGGK